MSEPTTLQLLKSAVDFHQRGNFDAAAKLYQLILQSDPDVPDALHLLGLTRFQAGDLNGALPLIQRAVQLVPNKPEYLSNLGALLARLGKPTEARAAIEQALKVRPDFPDALSHLGGILRNLGLPAEAADASRRAVALRPDYAEAYNHLGNALRDLDRPDEAIAAYRRTVQIQPDYYEAHTNIATLLYSIGQFEEAGSKYRQVTALWPNLAHAQFNHGLMLLLQGDFSRGWPKYEYRLVEPDVLPRTFAQPRWNGEPLADRTILLHAEQGLGDTIQFSRYAPMVAARGGKVILECQPELKSLLSTLGGVDQLIARGETIPTFDLHAQLGSLPMIFGTNLQTIPNQIPYLSIKPELEQAWNSRVDSVNATKRIGLVWAGRPEHRNDRIRSIPFSAFGSLFDLPGIQFFSLQKGAARAQAAEFGEKLIDWTDDLHDFADSAALLKSLDLLITADSAPAHLAGAIGVRTIVLIPAVPDFRWLLGRDDSPWYPSLQLVRQTVRGDWSGPVAKVRQIIHTI